MKHPILLLPVLTAAFWLTGCSLVNPRSGATLEVNLDQSYHAEVFDMQGIRVSPVCVTDIGVVMGKYTTNGQESLYLYRYSDESFVPIEKEQTNEAACVTLLPDGRLAALYNIKTGRSGGMNTYDGKQRVMEIYDTAMHLDETISLEHLPEGILTQGSIADADGFWYLQCEDENGFPRLYVLHTDGTLCGEIEGLPYCNGFVRGKSGKAYAYTSDGHIFLLDGEHLQAPVFHDNAQNEVKFLRTICNGGDHELTYATTDGIYGLDADETITYLVDFENSDLCDSVWDCFALPDGSFIVNYMQEPGNQEEYYHLRKRTDEEIRDVQLISLAGVDIPHQLVQAVCEYNQTQDDYRIVIKDYARDYPDEHPHDDAWYRESNYLAVTQQHLMGMAYNTNTRAVEAFKRDLLDGIVPDIICMDGMPYRQLSNKGILTDFNPMLDQDVRFNPNDYYMNLFEGLENGGKLDRIGCSFTIQTTCARTDLVGTQQGRTPTEYLRMMQDCPDNMQLLPFTAAESILGYYLTGSQNAFIDRNTNTCQFTSESFVQLLELAGTLGSNQALLNPDLTDQEFWEEADKIYATQAESDGVLLTPADISRPIFYRSLHRTIAPDGDMTLTGYPDTTGGNGGMYKMHYTLSLTSRSAQVEPVWEFIMTQLGSRKQAKTCLDGWDDQYNSLPVLRSACENVMHAATVGYHIEGNASEEEMKTLGRYIDGLKHYADEDPFITSIITEEAQAYFAGDITAQQAADNIQSRCSLYLSEQAE